MNRRSYLTTIGASLASPSALSSLSFTDSGGDEDDDDNGSNMPPTYYAVYMPALSIHMIHISIPDILLANSRTVEVNTETSRRVLDISDATPNDDGNWTIQNYTINDTDSIDSVAVGGVESRMWDTLEVKRAAMFFESTEYEDQGFVIVVCDNPCTLSVTESEYVCDVDKFTVRRVKTGDPSEVDVWTVRDGERASIPLYTISQTSVARWER
jgi:hypothetical protein